MCSAAHRMKKPTPPSGPGEGSSVSSMQTGLQDHEARGGTSTFAAAFIENRAEPGGGTPRGMHVKQPAIVTFNHGSFGRPCEAARDKQALCREQMELQPDVWFRETYFRHLRSLTKRAELMLNCPPERRRPEGGSGGASEVEYKGGGVVFGENTTFFINSIVNHFAYHPTDAIIIHSRQYEMTSKHCRRVSQRPGGPRVLTVDFLPLLLPEARKGEDPGHDELSLGGDFEERLVESYGQALRTAEREGLRVRLVILEHIVSMPSVVLPFASIASAVKEAFPDAWVCVDGAHAWGSVKLDLSSKEMKHVDAYVANAHKWMYSARGCAMMYCIHNDLLPLMTSTTTVLDIGKPVVEGPDDDNRGAAGAAMTSIHDNFEYFGTRDNTAILSLEGSLDLRDHFGDDVIRSYQGSLAVFAAVYLSRAWETRFLGGLDHVCAMATVEVPGVSSSSAAKGLQDWLLSHRSIYICPISEIGGRWYTRVSCPLYITKEDIALMAQAVLEWPEEEGAPNGASAAHEGPISDDRLNAITREAESAADKFCAATEAASER